MPPEDVDPSEVISGSTVVECGGGPVSVGSAVEAEALPGPVCPEVPSVVTGGVGSESPVVELPSAPPPHGGVRRFCSSEQALNMQRINVLQGVQRAAIMDTAADDGRTVPP